MHINVRQSPWPHRVLGTLEAPDDLKPCGSFKALDDEGREFQVNTSVFIDEQGVRSPAIVAESWPVGFWKKFPGFKPAEA